MNEIQPLQCLAALERIEQIAGEVFLLRLSAPQLAVRARPGPFVMVRCAATSDPLLRRPISICRIDGSTLFLLVERRGRGTDALVRLTPGTDIDLMGPLGTGFDQPPPGTIALLVAGGIGIAPLVFLSQALRRGGAVVRLFAGAATAARVIPFEALGGCADAVQLVTDDGSAGQSGMVTDAVRAYLAAGDCRVAGDTRLYACGPEPMLAVCAGLARHYGLPCAVSLEAHMACGVGACLGCVVRADTGYVRVCCDGPVFDGRRILWDAASRERTDG